MKRFFYNTFWFIIFYIKLFFYRLRFLFLGVEIPNTEVYYITFMGKFPLHSKKILEPFIKNGLMVYVFNLFGVIVLMFESDWSIEKIYEELMKYKEHFDLFYINKYKPQSKISTYISSEIGNTVFTHKKTMDKKGDKRISLTELEFFINDLNQMNDEDMKHYAYEEFMENIKENTTITGIDDDDDDDDFDPLLFNKKREKTDIPEYDINDILDKINKKGIDSLTKKERDFLDKQKRN